MRTVDETLEMTVGDFLEMMEDFPQYAVVKIINVPITKAVLSQDMAEVYLYTAEPLRLLKDWNDSTSG